MREKNKQLAISKGLPIAYDRLGQQIDALVTTDKHYDKKYDDMQARLDDFYDKIDAAQEEVAELQSRIDFLIAQKISSDNVYKYLLYFDKLYDKFTDKEKRHFWGVLLKRMRSIQLKPRMVEYSSVFSSDFLCSMTAKKLLVLVGTMKRCLR